MNVEIVVNSSRRDTLTPARDWNCKTCGSKDHFAKHCRSAARTQNNIVGQNPKQPEQETYRANQQDNSSLKIDLEDFIALAVNIGNQVKAVNDKIEGGVRKLYSIWRFGTGKKHLWYKWETLTLTLSKCKLIWQAQ